MKVTTTIVVGDATGKTVKFDIESMSPVFILWGDGTAEESATNTTPPVMETGVMGLYNKQHAYTTEGNKKAILRNNDSRIEVNLTLGKKPFPNFDPQLYTLTPAERARKEKVRAAAIAQVKDTLG